MDRACLALGVGIGIGSCTWVACGGSSPDAGVRSLDAADDRTGSVALQLSLPGGENIGTVAYSLTNGVSTLAGMLTPLPSTAVYLAIGGVPVGGGYFIELAATSNDGTVSCTGSHGTGISDAGQDNGPPFSVMSQQSTNVIVQLICVRK
jgi:hypothetical protein